MSKTYAEALRWASSVLSPLGVDPDSARYVLEVRAAFTPSQLRLHDREPVPAARLSQFEQDVARLAKNEPAQYIVGVAPFYGDFFKVTPAVLIPRFETEELVAWAAAEQTTAQTGLDVGTGSGAIGLTLAKLLPRTALTLSDVSPTALAVAKDNAQRLGRAVRFTKSDLFAAIPQRFDFIISNLPYISKAETDVMDRSTLQYEPHLALFAAADGLALFQRFTQTVAAHLNPGGSVYLEFGYRQQPALAKLFTAAVPEARVTFKRDMADHPRMVKLQF